MKVVLFCGGLGTRLREHSETIPKPLVHVGSRPILWHLMRYYAHFGHTEFVLCLGYRGDLIKEYFLNYDPFVGEDFVFQRGRAKKTSSGSDVSYWTVHLIDTGLSQNIGERLQAVRHLVDQDEVFLANYTDQLSDLNLDSYTESMGATDCVAGFVSVKPYDSFHAIESDEDGLVTAIRPVVDTNNWINGGFMFLRSEIFDYLRSGEDLVEEPFTRLIQARRLRTFAYTGFWKAMDTYKDKLAFDRMNEANERPWEVWRR